jgi:preprotein translocase subunit SecA
MGFLENLLSSEKRHYAQAEKLQARVLEKEAAYAKLSDDELKAKTPAFRQQLAAGAKLDDILPDAFATAREAAKRVIGEFPYPVQVLGGVLLHDGDIAEMKTGEGKTLTAVMPIYLNALEGRGAHVVTVNEYLAARDAEWMGGIYRFLGLSVGCNLRELDGVQKRAAYACDITYTTNAELGFDYLRDNMVLDKADRVLRGLHYAILDEVDSILIDESRTPLIISGPGPVLDKDYLVADGFAKSCRREQDLIIDRETNSVSLSEEGVRRAEKYFQKTNLFGPESAGLVHYIQNALRANFLMNRDAEYVVQDNEIILVDQFTGRKMEGREFSDGLHQAIQAKEGVGIKQETLTLATITYQNFFRLYDKLSGMTGTAKTEEQEFLDTYNMRVYVIPTNRPCVRRDEPDAVFMSRAEKYRAIIAEVKSCYEKGQPVLVGTLSVSISESLSKMLDRENIPHQVLNAKEDAHEAEIIAQAGQLKTVTIATNMAGRGTDIKLGEGVRELGGLAVLGSERHEAKRIDNQLRGRSGRQGDPGYSRFYCAMDDDLMSEYPSDEAKEQMERFLAGRLPAEKMRSVVDATQLRAEGLHYDNRKRTLEYDNVMMEQRKIIYDERDRILDMADIRSLLPRLLEQAVDGMLKRAQAADSREAVRGQLKEALGRLHLSPEQMDEDLKKSDPAKAVVQQAQDAYADLTKDMDEAYLHKMEKNVFLRVLDRQWIEHVDAMEHLKQTIYLRGYAQQKPEEAYQQEGYERFENMMQNVSEQTVDVLMGAAARQGE